MALLLLSSLAQGRVTVPSDEPYYRLLRDHTLYIYSEGSRDSIEQLAAYRQSLRPQYEQSFDWRLDERDDLVFTSHRQQIANGYATFSPNLKSVWFPSGGALLESMAQSSWGLALTTHEVAHLYHLNAKGPVPSTLKKVLGNTILFTPFWPIFVHPNFLTPRFLVEGNAVMNESRFNLGGRLHSGEARALVFAQIKAGQIDPNRLINNQFRFPYGDTHYLQGGYFQAFLAAKYGVDKTNQFFVKQGDRYLWPLILNQTFREHFGSSYPQEIREYVRGLEILAQNQQAEPHDIGELRSPFVGPLNHDANRIFFVRSDGLSLPYLEIFDKRTRQLSRQSYDLKLGKVFWLQGQPTVATSAQHDLHNIEYSLYAEGDRFIPEYRGLIVNDIRGGKVVGLDARESWLEPRVLVNNEFFDIGHSQPIADEAGHVYYFRQNGSQRILYKNRQPLFVYDGFYGKVTEVAASGALYFIANTDFGSSLFRYQNDELVRMFTSDRVVDARHIEGDQFVIVEVEADTHVVKIATANPTAIRPTQYSYGFPSQSLTPGKVVDSAQTALDERAYNSLLALRYSRMDFQSGYSSLSGLVFGAGLVFTDPLEFQKIDLAYLGSQFRDQLFFTRYAFTKWLPELSVSYEYEREHSSFINGADHYAHNQRADLRLDLPLLRWRQWDAAVQVAPTYQREDENPSSWSANAAKDIEETYGLYSAFDLSYTLNSSPALNFHPLRSFKLSYLNKLEALSDSWSKEYNSSLVQSEFTEGFPLQIFGKLSGAYAWAENHDVEVDYNPYVFNRSIELSRLTAEDEYKVKTAGLARLEVSKVFDFRLYSPRLPLGLDRLSAFVVGQGLFFDRETRFDDEYPANIFEWGYGVDLQVLLAHFAPMQVRLLRAYDTRYPEDVNDEIRLNSRWEF